MGDDISRLELRTLVPPFWGWFEMSKGARGKSDDRVDEALQAFWQTFRKDNRSATLRALETLR